MSLVPLREALIRELTGGLAGWRFVKATRSFTRSAFPSKWHLYLVFVNHVHDFDVIVNVAVEHLREAKRICIVGAELGNIRGTGQHRWNVRSIDDVPRAASGILELFASIGSPFLVRYSSLEEIVKVLRTDRREARLIKPLVSDPIAEAEIIEAAAHRDT